MANRPPRPDRSRPPGGGRGADPAELLRGAFQAWTGAAGRRWSVLVYRMPAVARAGGAPTVVRADLTAADAVALAALVDAARDGVGVAPGVPFSPWLGVAEAAAFAGVGPGTLRGWLACCGPKHHPFPPPDRRSYWHERTPACVETRLPPRRAARTHRGTVPVIAHPGAGLSGIRGTERRGSQP